MDARQALQELADAVYKEIIRRLHSGIGVNRAAKKNTLIGSHLEESIELYPADDGNDSIVFQIADYFNYVVNGRHHGMNPPPAGTFNAIITWVKEKNVTLGSIKDPNVVAAKVYYALKYKRDLPPRPFLGEGGYDYDYKKEAWEVITFLDDMVDDWMDNLYDTLIDSI